MSTTTVMLHTPKGAVKIQVRSIRFEALLDVVFGSHAMLLPSRQHCQFAWLDDENEWVSVNTQEEWEEALRLCDAPIVHLQAGVRATASSACCPPPSSSSPIKCCTPQQQQQCAPKTVSAGCCAPKAPCTAVGQGACCAAMGTDDCCAVARSRDPKMNKWLGRAVPASAAPAHVKNATQASYQYSGSALMVLACPLGPVGGGCIAMAGDGGLRQWQVSNRVAHDAHVPDSFFAIKTQDAKGNVQAVVLQSSANYDQSGFTPAPMVSDHVVPPASIQLLQDLPGTKTVQATVKYPTFEMDYLSGETALGIHLEALNPCIALNSKDSGIPVIVFSYTVTNPTAGALDVTLMQSQQNFAGWDGASSITSEVVNGGYGGNINAKLTLSGLTAIDMSSTGLQPVDALNGHVSVAVLQQPGDTVSTLLQYDSHNVLWQKFNAGDLPGDGAVGPSPAGRTWNTALACRRTVPAGAQTVFTFVLAWHFPNRYVNWSQAGFGIPDSTKTNYFLGNQYANFWPTITEVLEYTRDNWPRLQQQTLAFRDAMYSTTTNPWFLCDSAAARIQPIRSPSCFWAGDGNFYGFEGCSSDSGCCPLNCTHVWNYEQALCRVWPDLEQSMRLNDLNLQISPAGIIPSRSTVPIWLRRQWDFWPDYAQGTPDQSTCTDGEIGTVLKLYREVRNGVAPAYFAQAWHQAQKIMARWMTVLDTKGDGVIYGAQPSTYDSPLYGANTFMGSLYLAALRASAEMATLAGDAAGAQVYQARFALGTANYDQLCFVNGQWYTQDVDPNHETELLSTSTFLDALLGQWWANLLHLGPLLPPAHVTSTVQNVFEANHTPAFDPARQYPRKFFDQRDAGLYIATWGGPSKPAPPNALLYTSEGAWTGLEYPFGGLALQCGLTDVASQILTEAREKYDGTRRSPWNEIECGDHYTRPMAGFALFEIASGQDWNAPSASLSFAPVLTPTNFSGFFITGQAWGQYSQAANAALTQGTGSLSVAYGAAVLKVFRINSTAIKAAVTLNGQAVAAVVTTETEFGAQFIVTTFAAPVTVAAGSTLVVSFAP